MSLATPEGENRDAAYPVISEIPLPAEITRAVRGANPLLSENTATLGAETAIAIQTEWLGVIEAALSDLARRGIDDPILAEAGGVAEKLRVAIASPAPGQPTTALWLSLYACISIPFLQHFSSAVGNDLGHATAQKIIEVLASLLQYLKL